MNVTGVVEQLGSKQVNTTYGTKNTYSAKVNGQWYKFGFKDPKLSVGDSVMLEYTPGKWGNEASSVTKQAAVPGTTNALPPATPVPYPGSKGGFGGGSGKGVFPIPALDGQRSILRQNAVTNARELIMAVQGEYANKKTPSPSAWADRQMQHNTLADEVIRIAKKFESYTAGDMDMEAAVASLEEDEKKAA